MEFKGNGWLSILCLVLFLGVSSPVLAQAPVELPPLDSLASDLEQEVHEIGGQFKGGKNWKTALCRSSFYSYEVDAKADLATVDFELNEAGSIDVYADLYDLWAEALGRWRSYSSLCFTVGKTIELAIDRAELFAEVRFSGEGESLRDVEVKIKGTRLGTIRLGKGVPAWMEKRVTRWVNAGLAKLWASRLGDWVSKKLTDLIKDKIPVRGTPEMLTHWDPQTLRWLGRFETLQ